MGSDDLIWWSGRDDCLLWYSEVAVSSDCLLWSSDEQFHGLIWSCA